MINTSSDSLVASKVFSFNILVLRSSLVDNENRFIASGPGLEVIRLEYSLRPKIKRNDWLLVNTCPQAANHCALF